MIDLNTIIDYDSHPAFHAYTSPNSNSDTSILKHIFLEIDVAMNAALMTNDYLSDGFISRHVSAHIDPLLSEVSKVTTCHLPQGAWYQDVVQSALSKMRQTLIKQIQYENEKKQSEFTATHTPLSRQVVDNLESQGVSFECFPSEYIRMIYDNLAEQRAQLEQIVSKEPHKLHGVSLKTEGAYFQIMMELLRAYGILDGATLLSQCEMEVIYVSLGLSCSSQSWYQSCYEDVGLPTSKLAYLHLDHDFDLVKILMYLNEVDSETGPFSIIPESSEWIKCQSQSLFFKQLDKATAEKVVKLGGDVEGYYRPAFQSPGLRREFMLLPKELRGTSHFGDDILDGSMASQQLLAKEVPLLSKEANCAVFLGAKTLHRGGLTKRNRRWAFQIALRKKGVGCGSV